MTRISYILLLTICIVHSGNSQDTLRLNLNEYEPDETITKFFSKTKGTIVLTCRKYDSILFGAINQYRISNKLTPLRYDSIRLDSLAKKQVYLMHRTGTFAHYPNIPQMKKYSELMAYENIAYNTKAGSTDLLKTFHQDPQGVLDWWIHSPGHNANLLLSNDKAKIAAVSSMIVIKFEKGFYTMLAYQVYEADDLESVFEKKRNGTSHWSAQKHKN